MPAHYNLLHPSDARYNRVLLEAKCLRTSLKDYKQTLPLDSPTVYFSSRPNDLPIVIDTGASCSVTPVLNDFIKPPGVPDTKSMEGLNGNKTEIRGSGTVTWDIEDVNGSRDTLQTHCYFIPSATIRLFSPQVYLAEQHQKGNEHCNMTLTHCNITLLLSNYTKLIFPIQAGSKLPMMLTHETLHPTAALHLGTHIRNRD